ncbi:MAG: hypothetical protein ACYTFG_03220 [Planctomycetota bacterium]
MEHAFVQKSSGGELSLEQAHTDLLLADPVNVRIGRFLTPVGITNRAHEPPSFNGVERPAFDKYILPTTWSSDGLGVFGEPVPGVAYEAYVGGGLDGSKFEDMDGIRKGRIKERPSYHEPAVMARVDLFPFTLLGAGFQGKLRLGLSAYGGGVDNGNKGADPGMDGTIALVAGDFELTAWILGFRGAMAHMNISGARQIGNGAATRLFGWTLEGNIRVLPGAWKKGVLAKSEVTLFFRIDRVNTQYDMPTGFARNRAAERSYLTGGLTVHLTPQFVIKADIQKVEDRTGAERDLSINLGVGWQF